MVDIPRLVRRIVLMTVVAVFAASLLPSCSSKKNTAARRQYTAFITRYNIYYNGDTHYKETLADMESKYEDDYSSRMLFMHPVEAKSDEVAPQPVGDFTRSIEKAQKAIQLRSIKQRPAGKQGKSRDEAYKAWMKRDEYNPFLHNAWMMMGRSQYFNGDFLGAASTFFYVSRHFTWLPNTVTEAKIWQARSYVSLDWLFEAEMILTRIKPEMLTDKTLKGLYDFTMADWMIKSEDFEGSIPYLQGAIKAESGAQKTRLYFLLGQVYARLGRKAEAYQAYKKAGSSPSASYRTKFNVRIKQSEVFEGSDVTPEVKALKRMTHYDRNKEYLDQIYYAIGNLYLSRGDTTEAIANYRLAAEKSQRSGIDKAINQIKLGGLYFDRGEYELAQPCYAEAVPLLPKTYPDYTALVRRSDVLDELALYSQNVTLQDSLLRLSYMTPEQQHEIIDKIIKELKKKEKEEAEAAAREEYLAAREAEGNNMNTANNAPNSFNINSDNSWYFYNTATRNAGRTEFQRRWGSRKLEDDWRRRNKSSFSLDSDEEESEESESTEDVATDSVDVKKGESDASKASDPHYPEYYLAQIPKDDAERATANDIIQEGLFNMGVILKDKLDDYSAAEREFDRLLADYPDNVYRLDIYYNLYLMYKRAGNEPMAEKYRQLIISDFPDSNYGIAMRDPAYIENLRKMDARQNELYEEAYEDYLNNRNDLVHKAYAEMAEQFPLSPLMPKFMFIDALAYVTEREPDKFTAVIRELLERYPDTDLTPIAASWLKGMQQGRKLQSPENGSNLRGMIWDVKLGDGDSIMVDTPLEFDLDPGRAQMLVMVYDAAEVPTNELLFEIARHNFRSFVVRDFDLEPMNFGRLGMITISGFDNLDQLNHYRRVMADSPDFKLPAGVRPVAISVENFKKMLSEGRTFDDYFRYLEEQNYIDAQAGLLEPEEIETLDEADEAAAADLNKTNEVPPVSPVINEEHKPQEPTTKEKPAQASPTTPVYVPGSEGDDPLLDE